MANDITSVKKSDALKPPMKLEQVNVWFAQAFGNLELRRATYIKHSFARHMHEGFAISLIERGIAGLNYRGTTHTIPAGNFTIINPGEVHTGYAIGEEGWTYRIFYPDAALLNQVASEVKGKSKATPYFPTTVFQDKELFALFLRLHIALEKPAPRIEKESNLLWSLAQLIARHAGSSPLLKSVGKERSPIKIVREHLETYYAENFTLEQLARIANLSPFHLLRVFRQEVGLPPHAYLNQVRVTHAKTLLSQGMPIAQVAFESGFVDQSHFTKKFKHIIGVTPRQYRLGSDHSLHGRGSLQSSYI